jgi:hypothetical protein
VLKSVLFSDKAIESSAKRANPQHTRLVFIDGPDIIVTQAIGIIRVVPIHFKTVPIIFIQPISGAKPKEASAILKDTGYGTLRQSLLKRNMLEFSIIFLSIRVQGTAQNDSNDQAGNPNGISSSRSVNSHVLAESSTIGGALRTRPPVIRENSVLPDFHRNFELRGFMLLSLVNIDPDGT